jgi:HlyD family secretion protein
MKRRIIIISALLIILTIVITVFIAMPKKADYRKSLQFSFIEKGNITNTVSCTGTIQASGTVDIGSQVSGTVSRIYVDFNDRVKKDQILAKIDTTLLEIAVIQAESDLVKSVSQYEHDLKNFENNRDLHEKNLISDYDFESSKVTMSSSYASKLQAESGLKKAKSNLSYASIRSPIDGIVISRDIEEGQTIVNGNTATTLFELSKDLSNIEIYALVDENDIGNVKLGQNVTFNVESYSEEVFSGTVKQIRYEPVTVSNVVDYYVIIGAKNVDMKLLPGMTASVEITTKEKKDVLLVSTSSLKLVPTAEMMNDARKNFPVEKKKISNVIDVNDKSVKNGDKGTISKNSSLLWYYDGTNKLRFIPVNTGLVSGDKTEIYGNSEIIDGLQIISSLNNKNDNSGSITKTSTTKQNNNNMDGPPPMF